jgi:hypothetical protein
MSCDTGYRWEVQDCQLSDANKGKTKGKTNLDFNMKDVTKLLTHLIWINM